MNILTINAGSSSLKFKIFRYQIKGTATVLLQGQIANINQTKSELTLKNMLGGTVISQELTLGTNPYQAAIEYLSKHPSFIKYNLGIVINRVVHGGDEYKDILLLHARTLVALSKYNELAPLHQPYNLLIAKHFMELYPKLKHYACFDTAFHQTMLPINRVYALPTKYAEAGIKRYGFHGLSYQYISSRLPSLVEHKLAKGCWIIAHLGSGSSICGIKNGKSVVTTMGFSVAEGLPMTTRCGELDPAIPMYLASKYKLSEAQLNDILYYQSGLLGLSNNISGDMLTLLKSDEAAAKFAIKFYCLHVASYITKLATALGGMHGIIFTGGIGENSSEVRALVVDYLEWLNISLSKKANKANKLRINKKECTVKVLVVPTNEELAMVNQFFERDK